MELFVPSLTLFLVALILTYLIAPNVTPFLAGILAMLFLTYGVYDHYTMFAAEYRRSTWQEGLRIYSPAIMIGAVLLFLLYSMLAFFGGGAGGSGSPAMPIIAPPAPNTLTSSLVQGVSSLTNAIKRTPSLSLNRAGAGAGSSLTSSLSSLVGNAKSSLSRSFLETV